MKQTNWAAIVALAFAIVLMALDMSIVALALPAIGEDLGAAPSGTQWVVLSYLIPVALLSIPAGRWTDRSGTKPAFLVAVAAFGATSALIAASPTLAMLMVGRVLQGVAGAVLNGMAYRVVADVTLPEHRGRAMGIVTSLIPLSMVAGPGVGGLMVETFGWRSIFLVNVPIALITLALGLRALPGGGGRLLSPNLSMFNMRPVVALVRRPAVGGPLLALMLVVTGVGMPFFLMPYYLDEVLGVSAHVSGTVILTLPAGTALVSPIAGWLADRFGASRLALIGALVSVGGMVLLIPPVGPGASLADIAWRLFILGVGQGLFSGPLQAAVMAAVPGNMMATAGGVAALFRTAGFAIGPAAAATSWTWAAGGVSGLQAGATSLAVLTALGVLALLVVRLRTAASKADEMAVAADSDDVDRTSQAKGK
ncbi:MFS transporter [Phytoactinopolyspora limicola]|uniref:MFS transporter n=1 Tax=Phytoactinopolyspora limicola TaxID=2715536 RepID=UPI00140DFF4C|nr:MFS transporter [Phytoactinopolyspora limicola]